MILNTYAAGSHGASRSSLLQPLRDRKCSHFHFNTTYDTIFYTMIIQAKNLSFQIGGHQLIAPINLKIKKNEFCALVGPSGAGKSTLLKLLAGIKKPTDGSIRYSDKNKSFGYVPQDDIVHRSLSVENVLRYASELRLDDQSSVVRRKRIDRILSLLELEQRRHLKVSRLSGGQRKRVSIAVELLAEPPLLFIDEPTSGLDPGLERQLMKLLADLSHENRTIVTTTHTMESMDLVDRLIVVYSGYLAYAGKPMHALDFFRVKELRELFDQLKARPPQAWNAAFLREFGGDR